MAFPNAERGLHIANTEFGYLTEGSYGVIFRCADRVIKLFKSKQDRAHTIGVFGLEVGAYGIAMSEAELRVLTPRLHGIRAGLRVSDSRGTDVSDEFFADLGYELDFVDGRFEKMNAAPDKERQRISALFARYMINFTVDASVILINGRIEKVIDFSTFELVPQVRS